MADSKNIKAKDYKQENNVNYEEVFALVIKNDTIRLIISLETQDSCSLFSWMWNHHFYIEIYKNNYFWINLLVMWN